MVVLITTEMPQQCHLKPARLQEPRAMVHPSENHGGTMTIGEGDATGISWAGDWGAKHSAMGRIVPQKEELS